MQRREFISAHSDSQLGFVSWFISFGDLLTLLVCFFLLLTPRGMVRHMQTQKEQGVNDSPSADHMIGTSLASRPFNVKGVSGEVIPVWLYPRRVAGLEHAPLGGQEDWLKLLRTYVSEGALATVKLCKADTNTETEVLSQALGELAKIGESASRVKFETEAECSLWNKRFVSSQRLVALVRFSWN
jgi:hypothetical protein